MKEILSKPFIRRAIRTFIQTAVGYVAVNVAVTDFTTKSAVIGFAVSAIASGISAVMNLNEKGDE